MASKKILYKADIETFYACAELMCYFSKMTDDEKWDIHDFVEYFAQQILDLAKDALHIEIRYVRYGGEVREYTVEELQSIVNKVKANFKKKNETIIMSMFGTWKKFRYKRANRLISFESLVFILEKCKWCPLYGGMAWAKIAKAAQELEKELPVTIQNCSKVIALIDHIIDLEHNNSLFLGDYCRFHLSLFLEEKLDGVTVYNRKRVKYAICKLLNKYHHKKEEINHEPIYSAYIDS